MSDERRGRKNQTKYQKKVLPADLIDPTRFLEPKDGEKCSTDGDPCILYNKETSFRYEKRCFCLSKNKKLPNLGYKF